MHPRQGLVALFSSLIQFEADRFQRWVTDPHLRRSMEKRLGQSAHGYSPENFWALYWHKQWQTDSRRLAQRHLLAYLQEACYWVARKTSLNFTSTQYSLSDCFQLAIAQLDKVLQGFDSQQGFNLKNYASAAFNSLIRDHLRQQREVDICTDWSLLRKASQRRLRQALDHRGQSPDEIERYVLAWSCFNACYTPQKDTSTRRLSKPTPEMWAEITALYNAERLTQLSEAGKSLRPNQLEGWLTTCAKAIRSYLYPGSVSINTPKSGHEAGEYLDQLTDEGQLPPLTRLISQEEQQIRQEQQEQLAGVIREAIAALDPAAQTLLELYYSGSATQQQIATQLNLKQYAISRQLSRIRKSLLRALTQWSQDVMHITPSSDVLKYTSAALEEWLQSQYQRSSQPVTDR